MQNYTREWLASKMEMAKLNLRVKRRGRRIRTVDRLRRERNEWREYYDEVVAWDEMHAEHHEDRQKISRKEADEVVVPNWPKIHDLELWKFSIASNIVAVCGDLGHDAWTAWIVATFAPSPDIDGDLSNSGDLRFSSIDVKLDRMVVNKLERYEMTPD